MEDHEDVNPICSVITNIIIPEENAMDRTQRVQIVRSFFAGIFSLFAAFIGIPLIASLLWPIPDDTSSDAMMESFHQSSRIAYVANMASVIALVIAAACFLYIFVILAKWFIGPDEEKSSGADEQS